MTQIALPDGSIVNFPDDMSDNDIKNVLRKKFPTNERLSKGGKRTSVYDPSQGAVGQTLRNVTGSGSQVLEDLYKVVTNPIDTAEAVVKLGIGAFQLLTPDEQPNEKIAKAVGQHFVDRYGSVEKAIQTLVEDPVGILSDVTIPFTGGAGLVKTFGATGKLANIATQTGKFASAIDPINVAIQTAKLPVTAVSKALPPVVGALSGVSSTPIIEAVTAARNGVKVLREAMRGGVGELEVVNRAREVYNGLIDARRTEYLSDMKGLYGSDAKANMTPILQAMESSFDKYRIKREGKPDIPLSPAIQVNMDKITGYIQEVQLDPALQSLERLDFLKRRIDALDTPDKAGNIVKDVKNAVKKEIVNQFPKYAETMKNYEFASNNLDNITSELSLGKKVNPLTTLRKLQASTRGNSNAAWSQRKKMIDDLDPLLSPMLSGQALSGFTPRGMSGGLSMAALAGGSAINPATLALIPTTMPRVVGEAANLVGNVQRYGQKTAPVVNIAKNAARTTRPLAQPLDDFFEENRLKDVAQQMMNKPRSAYQ